MDFELTQLSLYVMAISVGIFTIIAAITDYKSRKIYNVLTVPFFVLGIVYQLAFNGWEGLLYGFLGFIAGFGIFFLIWMAGSGAAGDVKMMGALSMWLGFRATIAVMIVGTVFVLAGTLLVLFWSVVTKGARKTKEKYLATGKQFKGKKKKYVAETEKQKLERGIMPFALPVVLATWSVTTWMIIKAVIL
ncbi:prepilin peptidase [Gimesia benthica]|uniref:Prepilin peptidase n=1 Tax=Gimesia benthica TaxID=2608982 RepID=A0A6I6ACM1_9PLAN|nr:A24 family peptidase [Gimesia benthica]QGQ22831.1 prepilin peptidase [Gimesia benthica]